MYNRIFFHFFVACVSSDLMFSSRTFFLFFPFVQSHQIKDHHHNVSVAKKFWNAEWCFETSKNQLNLVRFFSLLINWWYLIGFSIGCACESKDEFNVMFEWKTKIILRRKNESFGSIHNIVSRCCNFDIHGLEFRLPIMRRRRKRKSTRSRYQKVNVDSVLEICGVRKTRVRPHKESNKVEWI